MKPEDCCFYNLKKTQHNTRPASMTDSEKVTSLTQEEMDCIIYDSREGDLETLQEIFAEIDPKLILTIQNETTLSTPIHVAAANGHLEVLKFLLGLVSKEEAQVLANKKNDSGNTPLHWAAFSGHLPVVQLLCEEYNADPFAKNEAKHDAIFEAEHNCKEEVENYLLNKYAIEDGFNVEDKDGDTKITYTPGKESKEADEIAAAASAASIASTKDIETKTENLTIN